MNKLYEEIYSILISNNIEKENILFELNKIYSYIENKYYKYFFIKQEILFYIKDIIWYNLEFLPNNEQEYGLYDFSTLGSKFNLISQLDNNIILNNNNINDLKNELKIVINNWNKNWKVAKIFTDIEENKESNEVIIYKKGESPRKYNYYKKTPIIDKNNHNIYMNKNVMLCEIDSILGDFYLNNIIYNKIKNLYELCNNDNKYLIIKTE